MTTILIGNDSSDRATYTAPTSTQIDLNYPANLTGVLTSVHFRLTHAANVKLGTFRNRGGGVYECISSINLGSCAAGLNTFTEIELAVAGGDYIGLYMSAGGLDCADSGGSVGSYEYSGDWADAGDFRYGSLIANRVLTIGGSGATITPGSVEEDVDALLTSVRDDYLPATRDWLYANVGYLSFFDYMMATYAYAALNAGGGSGVTLAQIESAVQAIIDTHETTVLEAISTQTAAIIGLYDALVLEHAATRTALSVSEGNLDAAITVAKGAIQNDIAAIDALDAADLASAVSTIQGSISAAESALAGVVASEVGAAETSVNNNTDYETGLVTAAVNALNNLSELAVGALVDAAIVTIGGEIGEAEQALTTLINALDVGTPEQRYEGPAAVTWGSPTQFTTSETLLAAVVGPAGVMDGCLLVVDSVPAGSYQQGGEGVTLHKYLGWVMFVDSNGNTDELQWLGANKRVFMPKHFKRPAGLVVSAKQGATLTATAFSLP